MKRSLLVVAFVCGAAAPAAAQLSALVSPGPLARPHASLEGIANCSKCHESGRRVTADKCLACHRPIAERAARRKGIHQDAKADCVQCHSDHAGLDGVLRPFDEKRFDHAATAGFALVGGHAAVAGGCAACHKARSYLTAVPDCATCHRDVHKGAFGSACTNCHSARTRFKEISGTFDHRKAAFQLTGSHTTVACAKCHVNNVLKGIKFASCASCHRTPHNAGFATTCTSCHRTAGWSTRTVDHDRTDFPLRGRHTAVACDACHRRSAAGPRLASFKQTARTCASCHRDAHLGQLTSRCQTCHNDTSFAVRSFRHAGSDAAVFSAGRHARAACQACHKRVTGRFPAGAGTAIKFTVDGRCTACHKDVHRGSLGPNCVKCHKP